MNEYGESFTKIEAMGDKAIESAKANAQAVLQKTRSAFVLVTLDEEGAESVLGCSLVDLLEMMLVFMEVANRAMQAMTDDAPITTKH